MVLAITACAAVSCSPSVCAPRWRGRRRHDRVNLHPGPDFGSVPGNQRGERLGEPAAATDGGGVAREQVAISSPTTMRHRRRGAESDVEHHGSNAMINSSLPNRSPSRSCPEPDSSAVNGTDDPRVAAQCP